MTYSIVVRTDDGRFGVAVASRYLAVGAVVPAAEAGVGALATQSYANPAHRPQGLALLRTGVAADRVAAGLIAADAGFGWRQLGVVGPTGPGATYTGEDCLDWAGGEAGDGWAVQGNLLAGPAVVPAMRDAWLTGDPAQPVARRLLAALRAGEAAGGDRRGRQSAALLVTGAPGQFAGADPSWPANPDPAVDLRVDDHPEPLPELARLLDLHEALREPPAD